MIRIAIADDHKLVRKSLSLLLSTSKQLEVVAEASDGIELLEVLKHTPIDTLLLDLQMPNMDGFETAKIVNQLYPAIKILVLTMMDDNNTIRRVIEYVDGFYTKNTDPEELENAILKLHKSGFYFERSFAEISKGLHIDPAKEPLAKEFTEREREILILTARELSNKEIAEELHISKRTVDRHKEIMRETYKTRNFTGVIMIALKYGYLSMNDIMV